MLQLTFDTGQTLDIIHNGTDLGHKWFNQVQLTKANGFKFRETNRIYNLNDIWPTEQIIGEILKCAEIVNNYKPFINFKTNGNDLTQDQLNYLHHHFEQLIGFDNAGSEYYNNAPEYVRLAIREFNINIHRMECKSSKRIIATFTDYQRTKFTEEEFAQFNFNVVPGDVYLNYCHTGKPLFDFFRDEDTHIDVGNILPQHCWKSDFVVGLYYGPAYATGYQEWLDDKWETFKDQIPFVKDDVKNAFGFIKVGKVLGDPIQLSDNLYGIKEVINYDFV